MTAFFEDPLLRRTAELVFDEDRNLHSSLFLSAAEESDGGAVTWLGRRLGLVTLVDGRQVLLDGPIALETGLGAYIVDNKQLAREFLSKSGAPTVRGAVVSDADDAVTRAAAWSSGVVLKPLRGSEGKGVTVDVRGEDAVRRAFDRASAIGTGVVLEEHIEIAEEYRCMATATRCLSVIRRVLPHVVGDGHRTIGELIDEKNDLRRKNPGLYRLPIPRDEVVESVLAAQGLTQESIPRRGETVQVRNIGGLTGGGEPHECTDTVDASVRDAAVSAVAAVPSLGWAGVDVVVEAGTGRALVLEINVNAGYGGATFPLAGQSRNVAAQIWPKWRERTSRDGAILSAAPRRLRPPVAVASTLVTAQSKTASRRLGEAFRVHVDRRSDLVVSDTGGLITVDSGTGSPRHFTPGMAGENDLLAPRRAARSHEKVRRFLAAADVPRPRGGRVQSRDGFIHTFGDDPKRYIAIPVRDDWSTSRRTDMRGDDPSFSWDSSWYVQRRVPGMRLRLYCTRDEVLAVTVAGDETVRPLSTADLQGIGSVGLAAVRALPGLRWAAVDVVHRSGDVTGSRDLVEGLTITPKLGADDMLVAGDLDRFIERAAGLPAAPARTFASALRQRLTGQRRGNR